MYSSVQDCVEILLVLLLQEAYQLSPYCPPAFLTAVAAAGSLQEPLAFLFWSLILL